MIIGKLAFTASILAALVTTTEASWRQRKNTDKSILYGYYPQLSNYESECVVGVNHMLISIFEYPYSQMVFYSAHYLNDLGSYRYCDTIDGADYITLHLNISQLPTTLWGGFCVPKECKQVEYDALNK